MEVSDDISGVLEELKNLEISDIDPKESLRKLIQLKKAQHLMDLKTEAMKLHEKDQKNQTEKLKGDIESTKADVKKIEKMIGIIKEEMGKLKNSGAMIKENIEKQKKEIDTKAEGFLKDIKESVNPEEVKRLTEENDVLEAEINAKIDDYKAKEAGFLETEKELQTRSAGMLAQDHRKTLEEKFLSANERKLEAEKIIGEEASMKETIEKLFTLEAEHLGYFSEKKSNYESYHKSVKAIVDEIAKDLHRKKGFEARIADSNKICLALLIEKEELEKKIAAQKKKTEAAKLKCQQLRATK